MHGGAAQGVGQALMEAMVHGMGGKPMVGVTISIDSEGMADAGLRLDFVEIGTEEFAGIDGTFFVDSPEHAGDAEVDAI